MDNIHQINFNEHMGQIARVAALFSEMLGVLGELWRKINLFYRRNSKPKGRNQCKKLRNFRKF